jgi:hypothetical protein
MLQQRSWSAGVLANDRGISELASAEYLYTFGMLQVFVGAADDAQRSLTKAPDRDYEGARKAIPWVLASKIDERYALANAALQGADEQNGEMTDTFLPA